MYVYIYIYIERERETEIFIITSNYYRRRRLVGRHVADVGRRQRHVGSRPDA